MGKIINSYLVKDRDRKATFRRLLRYLAAHPLHLGGAILLALFSNILALLGPLLAGNAIDAMTERIDFPYILNTVLLMILFYFASSVTALALSRTMISLSRKIVYRMRKELFESMTGLPVSYFDVHQTGDLVSRITYDIDTVNTSLSVDAVQLFTSVISMVGSLVMMLSISVPLILVFCITIPISVVLTKAMAKSTRTRFRTRSEKLGDMNGYAEEIISAGAVIKAYHQEEVIISRFHTRNLAAGEATNRAENLATTVGPSMNAINNLSLSLISILGAILYVGNMISVGGISSFVLYSRKFAGPINELANISSELQSALSAAERVFRVLDEQPEQPDAEDAVDLPIRHGGVRGEIVFEDVDFGYEPNRMVIRGLNLHAKPGQTVAIVGSTGAGKTTIINLLMRFYEPNAGSIRLDGTDIRSIRRNSLRNAFTMVLQDSWLFGGTIHENIAYGKPGASREEVVRAAKTAGIHHYISGLKNGYDTVLNEAGLNISKGQKQLMTIARAILKDSAILILDEATSNVDTQTEAKIQSAIRELTKGRTAFVIAHRLSTIKNADVIYVFEHGNIIERGRHEELLERGGVYADLYRSQFY